MGRSMARLRASSRVCVPTQLSEIAPAKHLLKIPSLFLLVPVWVDFTRKEGVSLALSLSTPLPEPFQVPDPFLFTKLAQCQPFWGPPGLPCPLLGLVHVHRGIGQPLCIVDPGPPYPAAGNAPVGESLESDSQCGFQKPLWGHTLGLHSRTSSPQSSCPQASASAALGVLCPDDWRKGGGPGQGEGVRTGCDGADLRALAFKGQQFPFTLSGRSEIPCGEVEEGEFQHMEEVLTLVWREGKLGRGPLGRRGKLQEGRIREHLAGTQLCFSLRVCAGRCRAPEHPSLAQPCCYAAQKPLSLLFPVLSAVSRVWV